MLYEKHSNIGLKGTPESDDLQKSLCRKWFWPLKGMHAERPFALQGLSIHLYQNLKNIGLKGTPESLTVYRSLYAENDFDN